MARGISGRSPGARLSRISCSRSRRGGLSSRGLSVFQDYWFTFAEILSLPFRHVELIWGIVPLFFALFLNELTSSKANFRTALQTGFSFLWAAAQWLYPYFTSQDIRRPHIDLDAMLPVKLFVTF